MNRSRWKGVKRVTKVTKLNVPSDDCTILIPQLRDNLVTLLTVSARSVAVHAARDDSASTHARSDHEQEHEHD